MSEPTTGDVLTAIQRDAVIVGSWPVKRESAKDLDVVIRPAPIGERNPVFVRLLERWRDFCDSSFVGHLVIYSTPQMVEIFEVTLPPDDPDKRPGVLTYRQAVRRSSPLSAYGVMMRAVQ